MRVKKSLVLGGLLGLITAGIGMLLLRFQRGRRRAEYMIAGSDYTPLKEMGTVKRLSIIPLIDWTAVSDELAVEPGVAYLIRADDKTILFDVGFNSKGEHPSPLLRNMTQLGIELKDLDGIFISHMHEDHVGGIPNQMRHTFSLSGERLDLREIPAWVPEPMTHPTADVRIVESPQILAPGIATTGTIPRQMFFLGWTLEQSMAINVEGKGIVLIIGCGHPTLQRILERAEMCFDAPLYGVIGGLHYPVTASRAEFAGIPMQRLLGTGKWPWNPINRRDVQDSIDFLRERNPQLVALSPHDSCDWSIDAFNKAFGERHRNVLVGEEIVVA